MSSIGGASGMIASAFPKHSPAILSREATRGSAETVWHYLKIVGRPSPWHSWTRNGLQVLEAGVTEFLVSVAAKNQVIASFQYARAEPDEFATRECWCSNLGWCRASVRCCGLPSHRCRSPKPHLACVPLKSATSKRS